MSDVLLVEDHRSICDFITLTLESEGIPHPVAHTVADALALIDAHVPAVILLDVYLPGQTGDVMCAQLRADGRRDQLSVIVLTAAHDTQEQVRACEANAYL